MSLFENTPEDSLMINKNDPEELLGSCSPHAFFLDDAEWPSAEHYYQAMKFDDAAYREKIRAAETPSIAKKYGNTWFKPKRKDFKQVRTTVMTRAIYTKCRTYPNVSQALIETGDQYIAERSFTDYFWGCGRVGRGDNHFGQILMNVRAKLNEERSSNSLS